MKHNTLLFFLLLTILRVNSQEKTFQFSNLSVRDGLSQNTVIRIFQDSRNLMWFCTRDGLNRYDGTGFKIYRSSLSNENSISSSDVTHIIENKDGSFWIGTHSGLNHFDPRTEKFTRYFHKNSDPNSLSSSCIKLLLSDKNGRTWIGTTEGLDLYDEKNNSFKHIYDKDAVVSLIQRADGNINFASIRDGLFVYNPQNNQLINYPLPEKDFIYWLYEDSKSNLWAGMWSSSLKRFNPITKSFEQVPLISTEGATFDHEQIGYMVEYMPGKLLLATRKGLLLYDQTKKRVTHQLTNKVGQLSDDKVISLFKDKSANIWIGSWNGGVDFYSKYSNYFKVHTPHLANNELSGGINSICEANGLIWLASDKGLITFDRKTNSYQSIPLNIPSSSKEIKLIYKDDNFLWLSIYAGGLHVMDLHSKRVIRTIKDFNYGYIKAMSKDMDGNYWIACGTNDPFVMLNNKTGELSTRFAVKNSPHLFAPLNVQDVMVQKSGDVWIGTRSDGLYCYNYKSKKLRHFEAKNDSTALPNNHVSVIFRDSLQRLWIGTFGGGLSLFNEKKGTFKTFNHLNGLQNDAICGIMEDHNESLWVSTLEGISRFSLKTQSFDNYNHTNGYPIQETVLHSSTKTGDNTLFVAGVNSFISFKSSEIRKNPFIPNVVVSRFKVWDDNVSDNESVSEQIFPDKKVKLKYYQSAFTIYFAALNYVYPNKNQYAYMLEGFDKNWNYVKNERSVTYTNIPSGTYTFRVKASNNDGIWNNSGTSFIIHILPPPWKTWWAYLIYFIIIASVFAGFVYYILNKQKLETDIRIKQIEQRNLEDNHQLKVRLFTNFSHELRTPLTLIIGPLNEILSKSEVPSWLKPRLDLIFKNAQRLLWLVNQLMDFRKLEAGFMKPSVEKIDFIQYMNEIQVTFKELATTKNIELTLENRVVSTDIWFDPILIEKVFFNILSNAFKHTASNGSVSIMAHELPGRNFAMTNENALLIEIVDNGDGIEQHEIEKIFEPFYQAHNHEGVNIYGTGIGLNLCKGIVELHQGKIWAESTPGEGSTFKIVLPVGNKHFSTAELSTTKAGTHIRSEMINLPDIDRSIIDEPNRQIGVKRELFTVLIVEDNEDVRSYVKSLLINKYKILEAADCAIGCDMAIELVPDLIISDIMTPNMSGIELCQKLKNHEVTNHIPIILLTALSGIDQIKEGLESLADDYIVKPFNPELLELRVQNLISIRKRIRYTFRKNSVYGNLKTELPSTEDKFMSKVLDYIKNNIDNPELRIDSFSEDIGMSRVQFYRKIKSITGKTPSSLILEIRMNAAAELLKKTDNNINEVAYQVGFNDSSYFGKCFKTYYGVTPSEYK